MKEEKDGKKRLSDGAASGIVAIIFLIIGFQLAVFVMKVVEAPPDVGEEAVCAQPSVASPCGSSAVAGTSAEAGSPAYVPPRASSRASGQKASSASRKSRLGGYEAPADAARPKPKREPRKVETFPFDPNTVSIEDLVRLGLSPRQAEVIENYRSKGGKFRSKSDFRKMYVVSDSLYARLEDSIDIPRLELNAADSAALTSLRGIGPYYAAAIVRYRESLGGFHCPEQLMEVRGIDSARFDGLRESVCADTALVRRFRLASVPEDSLSAHPYVGRNAARAIARWRSVSGDSICSLAVLLREGVIDSSRARKLLHYILE